MVTPKRIQKSVNLGTVCPLLTSLGVGLTPAISTLRGPTCNTADHRFSAAPTDLRGLHPPLVQSQVHLFQRTVVSISDAK